MIFCKHCNKQVNVGLPIDMDVKMWAHLRNVHPKEFKEQSDKELADIWRDNFRTDNPESDLDNRFNITVDI